MYTSRLALYVKNRTSCVHVIDPGQCAAESGAPRIAALRAMLDGGAADRPPSPSVRPATASKQRLPATHARINRKGANLGPLPKDAKPKPPTPPPEAAPPPPPPPPPPAPPRRKKGVHARAKADAPKTVAVAAAARSMKRIPRYATMRKTNNMYSATEEAALDADTATPEAATPPAPAESTGPVDTPMTPEDTNWRARPSVSQGGGRGVLAQLLALQTQVAGTSKWSTVRIVRAADQAAAAQSAQQQQPADSDATAAPEDPAPVTVCTSSAPDRSACC